MGGGGQVPLPAHYTLQNFQKFKKEVDLAFDLFWEKDQIRGFDQDGKRIGTGIPRVKPRNLRYNEYAL